MKIMAVSQHFNVIQIMGDVFAFTQMVPGLASGHLEKTKYLKIFAHKVRLSHVELKGAGTWQKKFLLC